MKSVVVTEVQVLLDLDDRIQPPPTTMSSRCREVERHINALLTKTAGAPGRRGKEPGRVTRLSTSSM